MPTFPDLTPRWRRIVALAATVGFVEAVLFSALAPLLPEFEESFDLSKVGAGVLTSAYAVGAFIGAVPSIWVSRRYGVRTTVVAGMALLAVSSVAFAFPGTSGIVFVARFGQGFGSAFAYTGALAWVTAVAPRDRRAEAIGLALAAAFAGALVGPLVGAGADWLGTEVVFTVVAVVALVLVAFALAVPGPAVRQVAASRLRSLAQEPVVRLSVWLIALTGLLLGTLGVLAPLRLDQLGWNAAAIGAVFALSGAVQAAINPIAGRLADTRGRAFPLRFALTFAAVTSASLVLDGQALVYGTVVVFAGMAYAMLWTPATALLSDTMERRGYDQASGFGVMGIAWPPGFAVGAAAGGALAGATADLVPYLLAAAACALSLPLLSRLSSTRS